MFVLEVCFRDVLDLHAATSCFSNVCDCVCVSVLLCLLSCVCMGVCAFEGVCVCSRVRACVCVERERETDGADVGYDGLDGVGGGFDGVDCGFDFDGDESSFGGLGSFKVLGDCSEQENSE